MSFYGNITNINQTSFTFDKIYPNRCTMEYNTIGDGVFIGRYVLVEYDTLPNYKKCDIKENDGIE